jgi:carbonic anhydrase/acetyltransferase-like protein (isoleucine patch superfamily)
LTVSDSAVLGSSSADSLTVNAVSTFNAAITSTNLTADSIKIGVDSNNEISTTAGNLVLDSFTGETVIDDNLTISGTLDIDGTTIVTDSVFVRADNQQFAVQTGASVTVFSVDSDNGNTVISGTLNVNGASVIDDTLNVTGAVDLDSTLNVDGIQTISNVTNASTGNNFSASGALQVSGGVSIARDLAVGEDFKVYGDFEVDGNVVQKGNQEFRGRVEFSKSENPTSLTDDAPIMVTNGGMTVLEDVYIGETLFLGANNATTITIDGVTGNGTFGGTLGVTGVTTLTTTNATSVTTTGNIASGGNLSVGGSNFIVSSTNGNTTTAGTLEVTGATTLISTLNVQAATDLDSTLNVDGAATFNNTITQNSTSLFKDNFVLRGASKTLKLQNGSSQDRITLESTTGNITAAGLTTTNSLDVTTNTTIGGTLGVTGQITGNVTGDLTGTADKTDLVNITETATSNLNYFIPFVSVNTGYTEVRTDSQNLTYNPSTNTMTVNNFKSTTNFEVQGNLNVTGNVTYGQSQVGSIANHNTDALAEGTTNLYFTAERVDDRVAALISGGTGISATYDDVGNLLTLSAVQADLNTDNFTEGSTNLFTTAARTRTHFTYGTGIEHDGSGVLSVTQSDINTDNVTEGTTNIFFTNTRARSAFSVSGDLGYNASTGVFSVTLPTQASLNVDDIITLTGRANGSTHLAAFAGSTISDNNTIKGALGELEAAVETNASNLTSATGAGLDLSQKSTTDLSEGTNLYYTNERVDDRVAALISAGTGISATYNDAGNILSLSAVPADFDTDDITEGTTNLYYTNARADARIALQVGANLDLSQKSTTNLSEGTNLYYTDARADARIALAAPNYATASQGTLADSAVQPADNISTLTNDSNFIDASGAPVQSVAGKTGTVTLVKGDVGLANVDNTSDANKPVSTAQQTALDLKADLASPALTGTPTAPTAAQATNTTQVATTAFVQSNLTASLLRAALGISEYLTDVAAVAGGLSSGDMYFNTTSNTYVLVA